MIKTHIEPVRDLHEEIGEAGIVIAATASDDVLAVLEATTGDDDG